MPQSTGYRKATLNSKYSLQSHSMDISISYKIS